MATDRSIRIESIIGLVFLFVRNKLPFARSIGSENLFLCFAQTFNAFFEFGTAEASSLSLVDRTDRGVQIDRFCLTFSANRKQTSESYKISGADFDVFIFSRDFLFITKPTLKLFFSIKDK